jgi:chorismate mutase
MVRAVRGAIRPKGNTAEGIRGAAVRLVTELLAENAVGEEGIISLIFSLTDDLTAANPAAGLRTIGFADVPLFCLQEAKVDGAMRGVIRVLMSYETTGGRPPIPVYMDGAEALRPDLSRP